MAKSARRANNKQDVVLTLTGIAASLQITFTVIGIMALAALLLGISTLPINFNSLIGLLVFSFIVLGVVWSFVDYSIIYKQVKKGNSRSVSSIMIVSGILQSVLSGPSILPGILILIAWAIENK